MITLVLTNRNRDLRIVKNCLESLSNQTKNEFELFFVDYGSDLDYLVELKDLILNYDTVNLILCPVNGQLWNKSKAINIVLKQTKTSHFLVGDVDLIFAPQFISTAYELINDKEIYYFQYGFLSQQESLENKKYEEYQIDFEGSIDVTGTTLFPTETLKKMNGYDEFYHGWGAEDTDIHFRLENLGLEIKFYDSVILVKHQWHSKQYRSRLSKHPFHSGLEAVNHAYMHLGKETKRIIVNKNQSWGEMPDGGKYERLNSNSTTVELILTNSLTIIKALLAQFANFNQENINLRIYEVDSSTKFKNVLRKLSNKKAVTYVSLEYVNMMILEEIIKNYRNNPYIYIYDRNLKYIQFKMVF
ncbi:glycosyltransferase family 2 protein [Flavobacterium sp. LB3P21]|uniref:glycosyltransferase family 2 protein n=1 Tax=Flavobacterium sp. LB3P21 TaxID=3401719 RepID=UPI003AAD78B7